MIVMNLVKPKGAPELELLFNRQALACFFDSTLKVDLDLFQDQFKPLV
jgi:hypothetical protein